MAQKDKVKELVGRGLNSYHTKALQQMDRIEKKNKEQNHKISILSNELDNDYLTKTEEGSVVSLEHSKEGMVYLDELQGNTLVNYCTDGSKEMTLNGDIDVEGISVTTTEGVDNGKVDVMCEGNTLVNLIDYNTIPLLNGSQYTYVDNIVTNKSAVDHSSWANIKSISNTIVANKEYTLIAMNMSAFPVKIEFKLNPTESNNTTELQSNKIVTKKINSQISTGFYYKQYSKDSVNVNSKMKIMLLEGDWTNRELPSYFEGMKSVGQDDKNGHKIEILSQNKNLLKWNRNTVSTDGSFNTKGFTYSVDANNTITVSGTTTDTQADLYLAGNWGQSRAIQTLDVGTYTVSLSNLEKDVTLYLINKNSVIASTGYNGKNTFTITEPIDITAIFIRMKPNVEFSNKIIEIQLEKGNMVTSYIQPKLNKKEISLNEPLRSLPNGVKDRIVKISSKWYIERNCEEILLDGSVVDGDVSNSFPSNNSRMFYVVKQDAKNISNSIVCDKFKANIDISQVANRNIEGMFVSVNGSNSAFYFRIFNDKLSTQDTNGFKQWLQNNPTKIAYQLATPTYEPLELEPILNTYNDITHISNNSIIPCNMKIKNTGYNAIIKPSTLYTVALDINKSGTIGINLGGAKVTTTNNVATITTLATLTDDSLRLYGKGIKGSKVRLLEDDKTNWIPSFFEGMKSSFEDKFDATDNTYKMEILSNDMSLFDIHERNFYMGNGASNLKITQRKIEYDADANYRYLYYDRFDFVKGKKYTIAIKGNNSRVLYHNNNNLQATGITSNNIKYVTFVAGHNAHTRGIENGERGACKVVIEDVWIYEGEYDESKHTTTKSNKIQFLLDEPLRSLPNNVRDEITFKDNKLMIERNIGVKRLTSEDVTGYGATNSSNSNTKPNVKIIQFRLQNLKPSWGGLTTLCNKLKTGKIGKGDQTSIEHLYWGTEYNWIGCNSTSEPYVGMTIDKTLLLSDNIAGARQYIDNENIELIYQLAEPTYEEVPHELQKIILEGYENGTLFFDTNIPPTSTVTYAGETPIVKSVKLNKTEVLSNTEDINDNIIPYLMDMDYRVVMLQLATEELEGGVSMARLFGGTYEMIKRDILSKRLTREEYGYRLADYFNAGKLTEEQVRELEDLR